MILEWSAYAVFAIGTVGANFEKISIPQQHQVVQVGVFSDKTACERFVFDYYQPMGFDRYGTKKSRTIIYTEIAKYNEVGVLTGFCAPTHGLKK